jgi:hypothetical protein
MLEDTKKLHQPGKGYKRVLKKEPKEKEPIDDIYFNPDEQRNWLFKDDEEYRRKRKKRKQ